MQVKIFSIPVVGGEVLNEELNAFLRSRKILQVEQQLVQQSDGAYWSFCVRYIDGHASKSAGSRRKVRKDYKQELSPEAFARFTRLRAIRKQIAQDEAIPAFAVFTDEELAGLARLEELTAQSMQSVRGIGEKKVAKYAQQFIQKLTDETSESSTSSD